MSATLSATKRTAACVYFASRSSRKGQIGQCVVVPEQAEGRIDLWAGWSLALPNPCMTTRNKDGSWSAWDSDRTIDVHIISVSARPDGSSFTAAEMLGTQPAISGPGWVGERQALLDGGVHRWATAAAATNTLLSCWVASRDPRDERWALQVAQSIRHDT